MDTAKLQSYKGTIHLVFSAHWDREWYYPFQTFRGKLVALVDCVLDELESGRLLRYQMDGQFIPVEDYLAIRPEKEPLLRRMIAEGRFVVGPWYNLPDEFLVSGESLVRNFQIGMRRSEAFGQTSKVGWLCDIFGHNSQMPQILSQFGIGSAILWRGADSATDTPFDWQSPDGSKVITHRFPEFGYCDFDFGVRKANKPDATPGVEELVENALAYFEKTRPSDEKRPILWFDGGDHLEYDAKVLAMACRLNDLAGRELVKISTLDDFIEDLSACTSNQPIVPGELREVARMDTLGWMIPGVSSSRIPIKQANHAGETLLTLWLEPWCAMASRTLGLEYPARAIELAWEYLLKNHPHDSICGCSTDDTHAAMPYRFDQSRQIAEFYLNQAHRGLAANAVRDHLGVGELSVSLFAPAAGSAQHAPEVTVKLPKDWPQFGEFFEFEWKPSARLYDLDGNEVPYQLLQVIPNTLLMRVPLNHVPVPETRQQIRIAVDATLEPGETRHFILKRATGPTRISQQSPIGISHNQLRNEFIEVTAADNGTISIIDLKTGAAYHGLLAMEDTADMGDGWYHGVALQERPYWSTGGNITFGVFENGPLLARLHIRVEWSVPSAFDFTRNERSPHLVPFVVEHVITLRKGADHVEIDTTVYNEVDDHRLRLFCPTGLDTNWYWSDTPFDVVERSVHLREDNHLMRELQIEMTPQQNWVATGNDRQGLALLAPGQYESAVLDQPTRPLCLTLLRGFRRAVFTDGNDGGQIRGTHHFRMALKPFGPTLPATELYHLAQTLAAPVRSLYFDRRDIRDIPKPATEPIPGDLPRVEGPVVISACYREEAAWVFRVFNPTDSPASLRLSGARQWHTGNLRGDHRQEISGETTTLSPRGILTLWANP